MVNLNMLLAKIKKELPLIKKSNSGFEMWWITNGTENKKVYKKNHVPKGWRLGKTTKK